MKRKKWLLLALVFVMVLTLSLAGCGDSGEPTQGDTTDTTDTNDTGNTDTDDSAQEEQTQSDGEKLAEEQILKLNWGEEPPDLDPQTTTDTVSFQIINAIYDGLARKQPDGSYPEGSAAAKSWDISDDQLTYTFHLKDDIEWSDGTPITAQDYEYAWKRAVDPSVASEYAYMMFHIKNAQEITEGTITELDELGVKALDEKTLEVQLVRPTPFFISLTQFPTYIPAQRAAVEKFGDAFATEPDKMVYSGPFVISQWDHEQKLVLEKNPNYWDVDSVILDRIEGDMIVNRNTTVNLFETDGLYFTNIPAEMMERYMKTPEYTTAPDANTWYLQYNMTDPYFQNPNIRKAFGMSIDVQTVIDVVFNDGRLPAEGFTSPGIAGYDGKYFDELRGRVIPEQDVEKAKELLETGLEELGITKEELQDHTSILLDQGDVSARLGQILQQMWKEAFGIELRIEQVTFAIRLDKYDNNDYQMTLAGWGADYDDAMTFMDMWVTNGGNNDANYTSEEYDALIVKAADQTGKERVDTLIAAEQVLGEDLPIYPIYHRTREFLQKTFVKGIERNAVGIPTEWKWARLLAQ